MRAIFMDNDPYLYHGKAKGTENGKACSVLSQLIVSCLQASDSISNFSFLLYKIKMILPIAYTRLAHSG